MFYGKFRADSEAGFSDGYNFTRQMMRFTVSRFNVRFTSEILSLVGLTNFPHILDDF